MKELSEPGMMAYVCDLNYFEAQTGGSWVQTSLSHISRPCLKKLNK
jgi:hypothetical protein